MKKTPYLAFTSLSYRILHIVITLGFFVAGFLANVYIGPIGVVILSAGYPLVLVFLDYFAFSGASSRKQKSMHFIKSSYKGLSFFKSAVKTDLWIKHGCILLGHLGYILAELIYYTDSEEFLEAILLLLIFFPISGLTTNITLIISRRIALTLMVHVTVCYICSMISTVLLVTYSFLMPEHMSDHTAVMLAAFVIIETISIIVAVILYKDCIKGYTAGFSDT